MAIAANDHLVPPSMQAVRVLQTPMVWRSRGETGPRPEGAAAADKRIFGGAAAIGKGATGPLSRRVSFASQDAPHGWRAMLSKIFNERFPEQHSAINGALDHADGADDARINRKERGIQPRYASRAGDCCPGMVGRAGHRLIRAFSGRPESRGGFTRAR